MKNKLLFPAVFRIIGFVCLIIFTGLFIAWQNYDYQFSWLQTQHEISNDSLSAVFEDHNLTNELIGTGLLAGLIFIAFAREKTEDERSQLLRFQCLQISHYLNYLLFVISLFLFNGISFMGAMLYLPYLFLVTFIMVYYFRLHLLPKFAQHEK